MKLREFIKNFSHNNIIRLLYKSPDGGYEVVHDNWNDVSMDHEIVNGKGKNRHFAENEVLCLASIAFSGENLKCYPEAINIVIEKLEKQPLIEEKENNSNHEVFIDNKFSKHTQVTKKLRKLFSFNPLIIKAFSLFVVLTTISYFTITVPKFAMLIFCAVIALVIMYVLFLFYKLIQIINSE